MPAACGSTGRRRIGRRSKGDRAFVSTRVTASTDAAIRTIAAETRTPVGDVVGTLLMLGVRHSDEFSSALDELLPLTRTTADRQIQFDPANTHATIVDMIGRAPTPVVERARELREAISLDGKKVPVLLVFSALLIVGLRSYGPGSFDRVLAEMYDLALDPTLAEAMLGDTAVPRRIEEQGVLSLMV
ncbi:hypothetical protein GS489_01330 [Rhodococcus hoagii]|nr:hypothetical protein [Prescottella equi]